MNKSIGYSTYRWVDKVKVCGGVFGGGLDVDTINRLTRSHFTVHVLPSGVAVFVDREGREVKLQVTIPPEMTEEGQLAIVVDQRRRAEAAEQAQAKREAQQEELDQLMDNLSHEEVVRRLRGNAK